LAQISKQYIYNFIATKFQMLMTRKMAGRAFWDAHPGDNLCFQGFPLPQIGENNPRIIFKAVFTREQ
jgi:hypothetical protein